MNKSNRDFQTQEIPVFYWNLLIQRTNDFGAAFQTQRTAIQGDVVILRLPPLPIGIEPMISRPAFILILDSLFRGVFPFPIHFYNPFRTEIHVRMDKDLQAICCVPENVIRAAPYDDTGILLGKLRDEIVLDIPQIEK